MRKRDDGKECVMNKNWLSARKSKNTVRFDESSHGRNTLGASSQAITPEIVFRKLSEANDIEAYLTTFEWQVTSANLERQHWAFKLATYLTGKAQQAYAALNSDKASDYTKLKEVILHRYNITVEK